MSYDIFLVDNVGNTLVSKRIIQEGGTQVMGGTSQCQLSITYNYSTLYRLTIDDEKGLKWLNGKTANDTIKRLKDAVITLGTRQYQRPVDNCDKCGFTIGVGEGLSDPFIDSNQRYDYWAPTPGNAGHALNILLRWAMEYPNGEWNIY